MRLYLVAFLGRTLIAWSLASGTNKAQETIPLKVQPHRLQNAKEVEREAITNHDSLLMAEAWYLYGKMYVLAGEYRTAQAYFMKSFRVLEPRGDSYGLNRLYRRFSENEERIGNFQEALHLANRSLAIAQHIQSDKGLAGSYDNLGRIYEALWEQRGRRDPKEYKLALNYDKKFESICYKMNDSMGVADASTKLGMLFIKTNNRLAVPYLEKAAKLYDTDEKVGNRIKAMLNLATAYSMADKADLALQTIAEGEKLYKTKWSEDYTLLLEFEKQYVHYYQAVKQWETAFEHLAKLNELEKRQLKANNQGAISRLNIAYQTQKKDVLLRAQASELSTLHVQQRFSIVTSVLLLLTAGLSVIYFHLNRKNKRTSRQNAELVKEQNHRVKNNLQIVSSLLSLQSDRLTDPVARQAVAESQLRIQSMAILHRRLYDGEPLAMVSLNDFIQELVGEVLHTYGYSHQFAHFSIDAIHLSADKAISLGLILNELVTNACKYAFPSNEAPSLRIDCHQQKQTIHLEVGDNGPGFSNSEMPNLQTDELPDTQDSSFGLTLIQAQVLQINGVGRFSSTNPSGGVLFTLVFKL